jgi:hypothetical protein
MGSSWLYRKFLSVQAYSRDGMVGWYGIVQNGRSGFGGILRRCCVALHDYNCIIHMAYGTCGIYISKKREKKRNTI